MNKASTINSDSALLAWMVQSNPYRELIPSCHHSNVCRFVAEAAQSKTPLAVQLVRRLGDQLELLSLMLPWGRRHSVPLRLMAEEKRCRLLAPLLPDHASIEPFDPDTCSPFSQGMAIRLGCLSMTPPAASQPGFRPKRPIPIRTGWCVAGEQRDKGSSLSAHSRSVPFPLVHSYYQRLMEREPQTTSSTSRHGSHGK